MREIVPRELRVYRPDRCSGGMGLELASVHAIDVVIVDYFMPTMNGQEVAMEMRRLRPQTPIILLTGAVDVPQQALKRVDALVTKNRLASQLLPAIAPIARMRMPRSAFV